MITCIVKFINHLLRYSDFKNTSIIFMTLVFTDEQQDLLTHIIRVLFTSAGILQ